MLNAIFNVLMTIAVYCFVAWVFWQTIQSVLGKFRRNDGNDYE